ncbi:hypothetical protein H072_4908 [Dactylellina haptotyla CBS 200.50]|uniref:intramembrane prenyl-peptidase Rce1 n=1 Tax=Dactylellina haptotyla (strain CBS 200.50) TaxID=1284197 RepID=S8ADY8_DACHA|nr:hypothetical protein H072_4908 [Dactylellina haptotyla CBS 200.50]
MPVTSCSYGDYQDSPDAKVIIVHRPVRYDHSPAVLSSRRPFKAIQTPETAADGHLDLPVTIALHPPQPQPQPPSIPLAMTVSTSFRTLRAQVQSFTRRHDPETPPQIPLGYVVFLSILFTCIYVGVLYLHPLTRPSPKQSRDAPSVIRLRIRAVYTSCVITSVSTVYALAVLGGLDLWTSLKYMGIWPLNPLDVIKGLGLTMILFAGPLAEKFWLDRDPRDNIVMDFKTSVSSWIGWRNYIVGPITEELTFRSHILALHLSVPDPTLTTLVFFSPLYFGIAHLHHFYEFTLTHPDSSYRFALVRSFVQFGYTTFFGWFAAWVYLRYGSLWTAIAVHSFCNVMGLPRFWGALEGGMWRTAVYYVILVAGAVGFYHLVIPMTESDNSLIAL